MSIDELSLQFQLKKLSFEQTAIYFHNEDCLRFLNFLRRQREIEYLYLAFSRGLSPIFNIALFEMKNVTTLEVRFLNESLSDLFLNLKKCNQSVAKLKYVDLMKKHFKDDHAQKFLSFLPNLTQLDFFSIYNITNGRFMKMLGETLQQLKVLKLRNLISGEFTSLKFVQLQNLFLDGCSITAHEWHILLNNGTCMKELILDRSYINQEILNVIIQKAPNLESLEFRTGFYTPDLMSLQKLKKLKVLRVDKKMEDLLKKQNFEFNIEFVSQKFVNYLGQFEEIFKQFPLDSSLCHVV